MLIDTHCHLDFPEFAEEIDAVVARAHAHGVGRLITISTRLKSFPQVLAIAEKYEHVFCSVGTHPHNAGEDEERGVSAEHIAKLAAHPKVVAIGEVGLDYHYDYGPREAQQAGLLAHIEAARITGLPVIIHSRNADEDMARILTQEMEKGAFTGLLHCFSSSLELARVATDLGLYLSFSGILTFKAAQEVREAARLCPAQQMLVETDAPYLAPIPHRGQRNEPAFVVHTALMLAQVREQSREEIAELTTANAQRLFEKMRAE